MSEHPLRSTIITYILAQVLLISTASPAFAAYAKGRNRGYLQRSNTSETKKDTVVFVDKGASATVKGKKILSAIQRQAVAYRVQGLAYQRKGNFAAAMRSYKRALQLDPAYVAVYNDLGVVYEASDMPNEAREIYLKSIEIDPNYLGAYTNLAMLCEEQKDYQKALFYWNRRIALSTSNDEWTQKARDRIRDIKMIQDMFRPQPSEREVLDLVEEVSKEKNVMSQNKQEFAKYLLDKAKLQHKKSDDLGAFKKATDAQLLDPSNKEIDDFLDKIQDGLLIE